MKNKCLVAAQLAVLALLTIIAFYPSLKNEFTNWDDPELVLANTRIRSLSAAGVRDLFTTSYAGFGGYTPLVFLSYAVDYHFSGLDPRAFHAVNLFLHVLNVLLVYAVLFLLCRRTSLSLAGAALFSLHPLHAEAVAWTQGRKDVLFSFFYLAALAAYLLFLRKKRKRVFYAAALLLFVLSLFSKVTAISFPLVLLLLEYQASRKIDRSSLARALPFVIMSAAVLVLAFITNKSGPPPAPMEAVPYLKNLGLFFYAFVFYIAKAFLPLGLLGRYSVDIGRYPWQVALALAVFAAAIALFVLAYKRKPEAVTFGIAFFVLTLAPTLPFHFSGQPYADRYMYLPLLGILFIPILMFALPPGETREEKPRPRWTWQVPVLVIAVLLGAQTRGLCAVWHDSLTLWAHVIRKDPGNATAFLKRGEALDAAGRTDEALADFAEAARLSPRDPSIFNNRGVIYFRRTEYEKAMADFDRAVALNPFYVMGYINRGILRGRVGQFEQAVKDFSLALILDKTSYLARYYRGLAFKELKKYDAAIDDLETAFRLKPSDQVRAEIEALKKMKSARSR
ncbi:MAG: tetratricopeptide repeat protein [Acidobacteriota bacterium]